MLLYYDALQQCGFICLQGHVVFCCTSFLKMLHSQDSSKLCRNHGTCQSLALKGLDVLTAERFTAYHLCLFLGPGRWRYDPLPPLLASCFAGLTAPLENASLAAVAPLTTAITAGPVCARAAPMHTGQTIDVVCC